MFLIISGFMMSTDKWVVFLPVSLYKARLFITRELIEFQKTNTMFVIFSYYFVYCQCVGYSWSWYSIILFLNHLIFFYIDLMDGTNLSAYSANSFGVVIRIWPDFTFLPKNHVFDCSTIHQHHPLILFHGHVHYSANRDLFVCQSMSSASRQTLTKT